MNTYIIFGVVLYIISYFLYIKFSHGLGHKAEYLQLRRFFPCAVLAVLPLYLAGTPISAPPYLVSLLAGLLWIVTYPALYYKTYHKNSSDFGFHLDIVFGLYIIGWLMSLKLLALHFNFAPTLCLAIISLLEFTIILIPVVQWIYYGLYQSCFNDDAIALIRETDNNEAIEFYKSLPLMLQLGEPLLLAGALAAILYINITAAIVPVLPTVNLAILGAVLIFLTIYLWNTKKGVFIRTGIIELYLDVQNYIKETRQYVEKMQQRLATLEVSAEAPTSPSTIILVVGESASRDYMDTFSAYDKTTTPWLKEKSAEKNFLLFPHAYACKDQTIPALENALTEANQYNSVKFYEACSIIDIARKAGYKTYWFSNQGHIGSAETAITLMANTADKAEWTKQNLNQFQYDESLLENLQQVNPQENNFIILHLMGSHFNFINRYPQDFAKFSKPGKYDLIPNYLDSLAYTDHFLQQVHAYATERLNLQALVYFSDHATIPDKRRSPNFGGFANVRIPMFTYLADEYIAEHPAIYDALQKNKDKYWTNDLAYELLCGIMGVQSNRYEEANSLASEQYKYTRDMLKTNLGQLSLKEDIDK